MKVSEVKAIVPLADIYELRPDAKYLFVCEPDKVELRSALNALRPLGIDGVLLAVRDKSGLQIFDLSENQT